jgi:hypothetical protein
LRRFGDGAGSRHISEERHPQSKIVVRDLASGGQTVIGWKNGKASRGELTSAADQTARPN